MKRLCVVGMLVSLLVAPSSFAAQAPAARLHLRRHKHARRGRRPQLFVGARSTAPQVSVPALQLTAESAPAPLPAPVPATGGAAVPPAPSGFTPPGPGGCRYKSPGIKTCVPLDDGQGSFEAYVGALGMLYVRMDSAVDEAVSVPPDRRYYRAQTSANTIIIKALRADVPEATPMIVSTRTVTVTLNLRRAVGPSIDTQISIVDPHHDDRADENKRRELEQELTVRLRRQLATDQLEAIAQKGIQHRGPIGSKIARNAALIVLRNLGLTRLGDRRLLHFSVQNRSGEPFQVHGVRCWQGQNELKADWALGTLVLAPDQERQGVIDLPASLPRSATVRIRVEEIDDRRSVDLAGVELR